MQGKIGQIGRAEFFSLALVLCLSSLMLLGSAEKTAAQHAWLLVLAALPVGLLHLLLFALWTKLFAGQSFAAALYYAFGEAGGKIVLFAYALFWLLLAEIFTGCIASFWASLGANNLPLWLYAALFLLAAACFAATGGTALARVALLVVVPALLLTLANLWLTVWGADFGNLLPVQFVDYGEALNLSRQGLFFGLLMFGGFSALLPVLQYVRAVKQRWGTLLCALLLALLLWLVLALGSQVVLGAALPLYEFPILQVFRLAEFGHWFSRFEVIGAVLLVMLGLLRTSALFAASVSSLCELWAFSGRQRGWIWLVALGCWLLLSLLFAFMPDYAGWLLEQSWLLWLVGGFSLLLPALAVLLGARRFRKQHRNIVVKHQQY